MNPLPFFPPPSRALSRLNDKPPPSLSLSRTSTNSNRNLSQSSKLASSRNNASNAPSSDSQNSQVPSPVSTSSSISGNGDRPQSRRKTPTGTPNADGSRSPQAIEGQFSHMIVNSSSSSRRPSSSGTSTPTTTGGRLGTRLPQGLFFDLVRPTEVSATYRMEVKGYCQEDAASLETLRYRQKAAPHLFLGAFIPMAPPKVSGPLTMAGSPQRKLIAYACATAASALSARSMKIHSDDEHSWLVCIHSVCVAPEYQRKGLALKLVEEFMRRLRRTEEGHGGRNQPKKGYECVALLAHEELIPLYEKAGFKTLGVSHVNWGSGGWFEMRRYIMSKDGDDEGDAEKDSKDVNASDAVEDDIIVSPVSINSNDKVTTGIPCPDPSALLSSSPPQEALHVDEREAAGGTESTVDDTAALTGNGGMMGLPDGVTSAQLLDALKKQSLSQSSNDGGPRNPGTAYSTIMGQTMAAKTAVEDAFFALEARLVHRESGTNLAEIYCPREECACLLLRVKDADWEVAELGPLASANLTLPNSPSPPSAAVPPPPNSLNRVRGALGSTRPGQTSTPVQAFWSVYSPMAFENIGFSKDDEWTPPTSLNSPRLNGIEASSDAHERKKPTKRGSLFRGPAERRKEGKEREREKQVAEKEKEAAVAAAAASPANEMTSNPITPEPVKVKYLLCADCDCGPLGYTVLPSSLQDGKFAQEVGKTLQGDGKSEVAAPLQEPPVYLIAADRVRYRFIKN